MTNEIFGKITKVTGYRITVSVDVVAAVDKVAVTNFNLDYVSIGTLIGTRLVDGRTLVLTVEEIIDNKTDLLINASISGVFDEVLDKFYFGTDAYPLVGENVYRLNKNILMEIFAPSKIAEDKATIGTYIYNSAVEVGYDPNVLFGKHLGVFGNTGSGKTCTVVSIIQNYIRNHSDKDIKFIVLDVNGEYKSAFDESEMEYYPFEQLRFHHTILNNDEYGRLFRASEGTQYPALKTCISELCTQNSRWDIAKITVQLDSWIDDNTPPDTKGYGKDKFTSNQLRGYLRTMLLRIDSILSDEMLMGVINSSDEESTLDKINKSNKKVHVLDLQVSSDSLDIVLYMLFKTLYLQKSNDRDSTHLNLVLEEAHRYINANVEESKLGNYYIDKLSREGRKFGIGLIISSQVPSMLSYEIVSQCNSVVMHKITSKRDMEFLRGVMRISNDTFYYQMSALEKQHAIVCGEAFPNDSIVRIHDARPLPRSNDPKIRVLPLA